MYVELGSIQEHVSGTWKYPRTCQWNLVVSKNMSVELGSIQEHVSGTWKYPRTCMWTQLPDIYSFTRMPAIAGIYEGATLNRFKK